MQRGIVLVIVLVIVIERTVEANRLRAHTSAVAPARGPLR